MCDGLGLELAHEHLGAETGMFARSCQYDEVSHTFTGGSRSGLFDIGIVGGVGGSTVHGTGSGVDERTGINVGAGAGARGGGSGRHGRWRGV